MGFQETREPRSLRETGLENSRVSRVAQRSRFYAKDPSIRGSSNRSGNMRTPSLERRLSESPTFHSKLSIFYRRDLHKRAYAINLSVDVERSQRRNIHRRSSNPDDREIVTSCTNSFRVNGTRRTDSTDTHNSFDRLSRVTIRRTSQDVVRHG